MEDEQLLNKVIICIDMKAFYASVSSVIRELNLVKAKLAVVGDIKRSESVMLAVTSLLKKEGIKQEVGFSTFLKREISMWSIHLPSHTSRLRTM